MKLISWVALVAIATGYSGEQRGAAAAASEEAPGRVKANTHTPPLAFVRWAEVPRGGQITGGLARVSPLLLPTA